MFFSFFSRFLDDFSARLARAFSGHNARKMSRIFCCFFNFKPHRGPLFYFISQVVGSGIHRTLTLTHQAQKRRFQAVLRQIRDQCGIPSITASNFDVLYKFTFKVPFIPTDFGVCYMEDLFGVARVPEKKSTLVSFLLFCRHNQAVSSFCCNLPCVVIFQVMLMNPDCCWKKLCSFLRRSWRRHIQWIRSLRPMVACVNRAPRAPRKTPRRVFPGALRMSRNRLRWAIRWAGRRARRIFRTRRAWAMPVPTPEWAPRKRLLLVFSDRPRRWPPKWSPADWPCDFTRILSSLSAFSVFYSLVLRAQSIF